MEITFSVNRYDEDGDISDHAIFIHLDDNVILRFNHYPELEAFAEVLKECIKEMQENYPETRTVRRLKKANL